MKLIILVGIFLFLSFAYAISENRKKINKKIVLNSLALQLLLAFLVLGIPHFNINGPLKSLFEVANSLFLSVISFTEEGTTFLMGALNNPKQNGFIFALNALPVVIFFSALMSILYHLNIMQKIVNGMAHIMFKLLKTSGAESLAMAANVFIGQTEAPLVVKPYISKMTRSELMALMTGGMATIAGGVLAAFVGLLKNDIPNIAGHLLTASVMSAPAAFLFAKIILPETEVPATLNHIPEETPGGKSVNIIDAAAKGASLGVKMVINIAAMLLAFIALIAAFNGLLGFISEIIQFDQWGSFMVPEVLIKMGEPDLSLQLVFAWVFAPFAFLMGIPLNECVAAGVLLGEKVVINEFVAYIHLSELKDQFSERTMIILSYALCGFANFSSIAIQIGGIGELAPERKQDLAKLGIKALIGGSLAAFTTASIASLLI